VLARRRAWIATGAAVVLAASVVFGIRFARDPLEYDFGKLRDSRALRGGGPAFWEDAVFGGHQDPCVILARDENEARQIAASVKVGGPIGHVLSIANLVPPDQDAKIPLLDEIRPHLPGFIEGPAIGLRSFTAKFLPPKLLARLTERGGQIGTPVLIYPANDLSVWNGHDALRFEAALPETEAPRASALLVFADVLHAIAHDGPRATLLGLAGVVLLVFSLLRPRDAALVLGALAAGVLLFAGLAGVLRLKLNMLSFIAVPITFGIGVDYAANLVARGRDFLGGLRASGGAIALCSLTTILGYSSLLVAHNQALRSFGLLADLGEISCLVAALVLLPLVTAARSAAAASTP
jgi:hypothetical protein